jgi:GDP-L-fucose synthase
VNILLTGSSGMVGMNVLNNPNKDKYSFITPSRSELNLLDLSQLDSFFQENEIDFVIHAAGTVGGIEANINSPVKFLTENTQIGINLINTCLKFEIKKLLNLASSCMYPKDLAQPLVESQLLKGELEPTNEGYAIAKLSITKLCEYVSFQSDDYSYKTAIPCNLYGMYDNFSYSSSHLIPSVIRKINDAMMQDQEVIEIWGNGNARREFMCASDFANFIYYALENFGDMPQNLNVGIGRDYSINEYYRVVADQLNFRGKFVHDLSKPVGMKQKLLNVDKLREFGWGHSLTLEEGILESYKFFKENDID